MHWRRLAPYDILSMNTDLPSKDDSNSPGSSAQLSLTPTASSHSQRKERGAIAAQACDTCRTRKQKCDEQRPKCSTCQRFKLECNYREPLPTKKDKTLVEILEALKMLDAKVDGLILQGTTAGPPSIYGPGIIQPTPLVANPPGLLGSDSLTSVPVPSLQHSDTSGSVSSSGPYRYASASHQILNWPVIKQLLDTAATKLTNPTTADLEQNGTAIVFGLDDNNEGLPSIPVGPLVLTDISVNTLPAPGVQLQPPSNIINVPGTMAAVDPTALDWQSMQRLSVAYFDTFNFLHPILDRRTFVENLMGSIGRDGFDGSITSTLAFLVFALGEVAISGLSGIPLNTFNGRPGGVRGGTATQPPGLALFNEARKRLGFNFTECSIENVQALALAGLYCNTCSRHMDFWRFSATASLACQTLIQSKPSELTSTRADLLRRAYWYCSITETCFHMELGLPLTGLEKLEDLVGWPDFSGNYTQDDYLGNQASHFQEHFASQIVLQRLSKEFHDNLTHASLGTLQPSLLSHVPGTDKTGYLPNIIKQLTLQLDQWRGALPTHLLWQEAHPAEFPNPIQAVFNQPMFPPTVTPIPSISSASGFMFSTDLNSPPAAYPYAMDVQVALLRTRFYHLKYVLHRPYLYKALHHPDGMTREDAEGAAECLKACLRWPVALSPTCTHKRMIPCIFFWTQSLMSILLLLHLSQQVPIIMRIRQTLCGERFELEASETVGLYLDWMRDLKVTDRAAAWNWHLVKDVYGIDFD